MTTQKQQDENSISAYNRQNMAVNPAEATATARWSNTQEISAHDYHPEKNIWLGTHGQPDEFTGQIQHIGYEDDRHMLTIAGSRAGKGRSSIIPVLLDYPQSVFVLDPKGENATLTAQRRGSGSQYIEGMKQQVAVLDPFGIADIPESYLASFNPLEWFPDGDGAIYEASILAESFITSDNKGGDDHWNESARNVIQAIILHVKTGQYFKNDQRDLITCRRLLMEGDTQSKANILKSIQTKIIDLESADDPKDTDLEQLDILNEQLEHAQSKHPFDYLISNMLKNEAYEGFVKQWASSFYFIPPNEKGSILSTARRHTSFLDGQQMASTLQGQSSFELSDLRNVENGFSLYLCLPARYLPTHGRWLRALLSQTLSTFERMGTAPHGQRRVLFILDEFASLGYLALLEKAAGLIAGYGVKLWFVLQDLNQLKKNYRESWETFIGNAGMIQAFGVTDKTTTDYLSTQLGRIELQRTVVTTSEGINTSEAHGTVTGENKGGSEGFIPGTNLQGNEQKARSHNQDFIETGRNTGESTSQSTTTSTGKSESTSRSLNFTQANLMNADEIASFFARETAYQLVMIQGQRPIAIHRQNYDEYDYFLGKYKHDYMDLECLISYRTQQEKNIKERIEKAIREEEALFDVLNKIERDTTKLKRYKLSLYIACGVSVILIGILSGIVNIYFLWSTLLPIGLYLYTLYIDKIISKKNSQWLAVAKSKEFSIYKLYTKYEMYIDKKMRLEIFQRQKRRNEY